MMRSCPSRQNIIFPKLLGQPSWKASCRRYGALVSAKILCTSHVYLTRWTCRNDRRGSKKPLPVSYGTDRNFGNLKSTSHIVSATQEHHLRLRSSRSASMCNGWNFYNFSVLFCRRSSEACWYEKAFGTLHEALWLQSILVASPFFDVKQRQCQTLSDVTHVCRDCVELRYTPDAEGTMSSAEDS
jgi:hypothetical protein